MSDESSVWSGGKQLEVVRALKSWGHFCLSLATCIFTLVFSPIWRYGFFCEPEWKMPRLRQKISSSSLLTKQYPLLFSFLYFLSTLFHLQPNIPLMSLILLKNADYNSRWNTYILYYYWFYTYLVREVEDIIWHKFVQYNRYSLCNPSIRL